MEWERDTDSAHRLTIGTGGKNVNIPSVGVSFVRHITVCYPISRVRELQIHQSLALPHRQRDS